MVTPQDAHVSPTPSTSLDNDSCALVKNAHEGNRAGGFSLSGRNQVSFGPQPRKVKTRSSASLMNPGHVFQSPEDSLHGIFDRKHETGRKLTERSPGIHECGRIGQKFKVGHHPEKLLFDLLFFSL